MDSTVYQQLYPAIFLRQQLERTTTHNFVQRRHLPKSSLVCEVLGSKSSLRYDERVHLSNHSISSSCEARVGNTIVIAALITDESLEIGTKKYPIPKISLSFENMALPCYLYSKLEQENIKSRIPSVVKVVMSALENIAPTKSLPCPGELVVDVFGYDGNLAQAVFMASLCCITRFGQEHDVPILIPDRIQIISIGAISVQGKEKHIIQPNASEERVCGCVKDVLIDICNTEMLETYGMTQEQIGKISRWTKDIKQHDSFRGKPPEAKVNADTSKRVRPDDATLEHPDDKLPFPLAKQTEAHAEEMLYELTDSEDDS